MLDSANPESRVPVTVRKIDMPSSRVPSGQAVTEGQGLPPSGVIVAVPIPGGRMSLTSTSRAADEPLLVTRTRQLTVSPAVTTPGPVLLTDRSADSLIDPTAVEELLSGAGSVVGEVTVAVLRSVLPRVWLIVPVTMITTWLPAPGATAPRSQLTRPPAVTGAQAPAPMVTDAEAPITSGGNWSVTVTDSASDGPRLVTSSSKVTAAPATGCPEVSALPIRRSALGCTGVELVAELLSPVASSGAETTAVLSRVVAG